MKTGTSLRTRIIMLLMVAIIPLLVLFLFKAWLNAQAGVTRATANLKFAASLVAANHERVGDAAHQVLMALANAPGLLSNGPAECRRYLTTLNNQLAVYTNLGIIGLDGYFVCDGVGSPSNVFVGDRDYFKSALTARGLVVSGYMVGRATGKPIITLQCRSRSKEK